MSPRRGWDMHRLRESNWSADAQERLSELAEAKRVLDIMIEEAVAECRRGVASGERVDYVDGEVRHDVKRKPMGWAQIADALGISKQAAWKRFRDV